MKLQILGSAAGGRVPNPFCRCAVCEQARKLGGKNIRTQTQVRIDGRLLVDFGQDTYGNCLRFGGNLTQVETILLTHEHWDHFLPELLQLTAMQRDGDQRPLRVYGNEACGKGFAALNNCGRCSFTRVKPYDTVCAGGYTITALPADHDADEPLCYIISDGEKTILYSTDTGLFADEVYDFIAKGSYHFDAVLADATFGFQTSTNGKNHMSLAENEVHRTRLGAACTKDTKWVLVHLAHIGLERDGKPVSAEELEKVAAEKQMLCAFDGMEIEL